MEKELNKLQKGLISVFLANVINLVISILTTFILPKYLSVSSYAAIKTYNLYVSYAGILSLGFADGMFLKYGGIDIEKIEKKSLEKNLSTFRIFQITICIMLLLLSLILRDKIFIAFVITVFPINMIGYFKLLYQSIGEFKKYSKAMNAMTITTFMINIILLFIIKTNNYNYYLIAYVFFQFIIWIFLEIYLKKTFKYNFSLFIFDIKEMISNIKDGFLLMLGNLSNIILTSMDRLFIKALMNTLAFAQYSFACSLENFISVATTPITVTLYNYFCKIKSETKIRKIRNIVTILGAFLISAAFPGKYILETYLTKYKDASNVMFYLFASQMMYVIIKGIYLNLYKSNRMQNKYFIKLLTIIAIGFLLNIIFYKIIKTKEAFAIGTFTTSIIWLILSSIDFKWLKYNIKEILFIVISLCTFIFLENLNAFAGFLIYILVVFIISIILLKNDFIYLIKYLKKKV